MKNKLMHYLSSVYFVNQPLHVLGIFVAHHQEVCCIYTTNGTCCACTGWDVMYRGALSTKHKIFNDVCKISDYAASNRNIIMLTAWWIAKGLVENPSGLLVGAVTFLTEGQLWKASVGRGSPGGCQETDAFLTRSEGDAYWLTSQLNFLSLLLSSGTKGILLHTNPVPLPTTKSSFLHLSFSSQMRPIPLRFFLISSLSLNLEIL